jgi:molybdate transport system substrate-binding protein
MKKLALVVVAVAVITPPAGATELLVHAASSLTESLREIAALHEASTGVKVRLDLGGSNTLARQILEGAPGDVFVSADEARMDQVARAGLLDAATRRSLLSNALVVVVAADSELAVGSTPDLAAKAVESVALADPGSVPAGIYAKEHLRRVGAWEAVRPKVVPTENVRGALAAVASGNVDAAIVYATDARTSAKVRVAFTVPAGQVPEISCPVAVLSGSGEPDAARAFVEFLSSPEASAVFERLGFVVKR